MWNKMMDFLGLSDEESGRRKHTEESQEAFNPDVMPLQRKGAVVNLHTQRQLKLLLCEPKTYDEAKEIADNLKFRKPVVLNLHQAQFDHALRILDFISGTLYALGGRMEKIGHQIFLCAPDNVEVQGEISDLLKQQVETNAPVQKIK